jgi:hypothetical protein
MFKHALVSIGLVALVASPLAAGSKGSVVGDYVEARSAEVFVGGCQLGNEGEAGGRQAVMAWRVDQGRYAGVPLDGLTVVAAVSADTNLGYHELGGRRPSRVRAAVMVDERATPAQRTALVSLVRSLSRGLVSDVVEVRPVPIVFTRDATHVSVSAGAAQLDVATHMDHDPYCGAMQWYTPLAAMSRSAMGVTLKVGYLGRALGTRWQQEDRKSAFYGTFAY